MKKRFSLFGKKVHGTLPEQKNSAAPEKSSSIFQNIHELPLHRFIDCLEENYSSLIKPGTGWIKPTEKELFAAWTAILAEYSEAVGTAEYKVYVSLYKEISIYAITLEQIHFCVILLRSVYSKYFADQLNKILKTKCVFNILDRKTYDDELNKCERLAKGIKLRMDLKESQFKAIKDKYEGEADKEENNNTRAFFSSMLVTLSDLAKYHITDHIMVGEYTERIKRYNKHVEQLNSKK